VINLSAADSKPRFSVEVRKTFFEVMRGKGQVPIELHYELPFLRLERSIAVIECFDDAPAGFPESSIHSMYGADPGELDRILVDNLARSVARTIVDDYPFQGSYGLIEYAFDSLPKMLFFIAHGGNNNVAFHFAYVTHSFGMPK
jgi:hypothetical protein